MKSLTRVLQQLSIRANAHQCIVCTYWMNTFINVTYVIKNYYKSILLLIFVNCLTFFVWVWVSVFFSPPKLAEFSPCTVTGDLWFLFSFSLFYFFFLPFTFPKTPSFLKCYVQLHSSPVRTSALHLRAVVSKGRARSLPFSGLHPDCATQYQPSKEYSHTYGNVFL